MPPKYYIALIKVDALDKILCLDLLNDIKQYAYRYSVDSSYKILGPVPAPIEKKNYRFYWRLIIQSSTRLAIHQLVTNITQYVYNKNLTQKLRWSVDIDPQNMS